MHKTSFGLSLGFCLVLGLISIGCSPKPVVETEDTQDVAEEEVAESLDIFSLTGYGVGGKKNWELEGKTADILEEAIYLTEVVSKIYSEDRVITLVADEGAFQPHSNSMELNKNVTMTIGPEKEGEAPTIINCLGPLKVDYRNNFAVFNDEVEVNDSRGEIYSDVLEVYFSSTSSESAIEDAEENVDKLIARGHVEIHHGKNVSYSQEAIYLTKDGRLTLIGRPRLVIHSTEELEDLFPSQDKQ